MYPRNQMPSLMTHNDTQMTLRFAHIFEHLHKFSPYRKLDFPSKG